MLSDLQLNSHSHKAYHLMNSHIFLSSPKTLHLLSRLDKRELIKLELIISDSAVRFSYYHDGLGQ